MANDISIYAIVFSILSLILSCLCLLSGGNDEVKFMDMEDKIADLERELEDCKNSKREIHYTVLEDFQIEELRSRWFNYLVETKGRISFSEWFYTVYSKKGDLP